MAIMRRGVHPVLEAEADRLLRTALKGTTRHSDKSDILTPWKTQERYRREVYVTSGSPDPAIRKGVFGRVLNPSNPELNSRDGIARQRRVQRHEPQGRLGSLGRHVMGTD